jgi:hypothetical protein
MFPGPAGFSAVVELPLLRIHFLFLYSTSNRFVGPYGVSVRLGLTNDLVQPVTKCTFTISKVH